MNPIEQQAVFAIMATVIVSFAYFYLLEWIGRRSRHREDSTLTILYVWRKVSGFMLFGILPGVTAWVYFGFDPSIAGFNWGGTTNLWPWIAGASVFLISLNLLNSRNTEIRAMYPELRLQKWSPARVMLAAAGWVVYLSGYEYLFRGLLLFSCYEAFGLWPAIAINLALYSTLHLQKGMKEAIATLPFGALVCFLTLESGSIIPAIFIHSIQAVSCEMMCVYRNPDMKFSLLK